MQILFYWDLEAIKSIEARALRTLILNFKLELKIGSLSLQLPTTTIIDWFGDNDAQSGYN